MIDGRGESVGVRNYVLAGTIAVGLLVLGLGLIAPEAHARSFATSSSFGFYKGNPNASGYPDSFLGQISSKKKKCVNKRLVKVFRKRPGRDRLIGRDRASSTGQWIVERRRMPRGRYYVKVPRIKFGAGRRNVCRAYKSSLIPVR